MKKGVSRKQNTLIFPKIKHFLPFIEMFVFLENLACFIFLKHPLSDLPFCLITDEFLKVTLQCPKIFSGSVTSVKGL